MSFNSTPKELIEQNINGLLSIHDSWQRIPMDAIAKITNGFAFKSSEFNTNKDGLPLIRIRDVLKGSTSTYYSGPVPEGYWVNPEDLIVGMDGDFNTTIWCSKPALLNQRVCKIDIDEEKYSKRFFFHTLPGYLSAINANTSSVTVKHLSSRTLQETLFPLPPLAEQKIIAEKLDTLLAQVDSTKAHLERIPQILKRFRQAVLAAAVNGRLTESWRTENASKTTKNLLRDHIPLPKPARWKTRATSLILGVHATAVGNPGKSPVAEWQWVPLVDVARMESGHTPSRNKPEYWDGEICWIGIRDANRNHSSTIFDTEQKTNELGIANSASRLLPKGTVCISRTASVGYVVKMGKSMATSQDFVNWVPSDVIDADWLKWLFVAEKESLFKFGKGSTHTTIYFPEWLSLHILLPHISEQLEIVRRVEQLFAYADTIEKQVNNALTRVNNLTQSILAKAFRGELTVQWRAENPDLISGENSAAALLEKIKAERAASGGKKTSRKKA